MKKLVYILSCLFLLSTGFAACSSDYDEPEQPNSHQDEMPVDSAAVDPNNNPSAEYRVITTVPVSDEVKAFFDEALPMTDIYFNDVDFASVEFNLEPEHIIPAYPVYVVFNNEDEMKERYLGEKDLPKIDFEKYTLIIGDCFLGNSTILESFSIEVHKYFDYNEFVIKTTSATQGHGGCAHSCFWGLFPKIDGIFRGISWEEDILK